MPAGTFLPPGLTTSDVKITSGGTDNYVMTAVDGETIQGEANLQFDSSTLTVTGDAVITDDLTLNSDSAVFNMGDDSGFSITHDGDLGATIAGSPITITAAEASTWSTSSGALTITSAAAATWSTAAGNLSLDAASGSAIRLNDAQANVDVVIESDAADNLFHADAGLGAVAINTAASGTRVFEVGGSFTSTAGYYGTYITTLGTIVGSNDGYHFFINAGMTGASGATHNIIATAVFNEPQITVNGSTINNTATVYIGGAATEAGSSQNYALWVDAGESRFDGDIGAAATRVPKIWTTNQDTTNAENVSSWSHVKENINAYTEDALAILRKASVVSFSHVTDIDPSGRIKLGLLADSIDEPLAAPMGEYELGYGTGPRIDMMGLAALAVRSIQELADRVDSLELEAQLATN